MSHGRADLVLRAVRREMSRVLRKPSLAPGWKKGFSAHKPGSEESRDTTALEGRYRNPNLGGGHREGVGGPGESDFKGRIGQTVTTRC